MDGGRERKGGNMMKRGRKEGKKLLVDGKEGRRRRIKIKETKEEEEKEKNKGRRDRRRIRRRKKGLIIDKIKTMNKKMSRKNKILSLN